MRFDTPATTNPIDRLKVIGHPISRISELMPWAFQSPPRRASSRLAVLRKRHAFAALARSIAARERGASSQPP